MHSLFSGPACIHIHRPAHLWISCTTCTITLPPCTPSQHRHSRGLRLRPHSSNSSASGLGSSSPTKSGSDDEPDTRSSGGDSRSLEQYHSSSPDIFLGKNEDPTDAGREEDGSDDEEAPCLLDISNSDSEEVHKAATHDKACQSNVLYTAWLDKQVHNGNDDIA